MNNNNKKYIALGVAIFLAAGVFSYNRHLNNKMKVKVDQFYGDLVRPTSLNSPSSQKSVDKCVDKYRLIRVLETDLAQGKNRKQIMAEMAQSGISEEQFYTAKEALDLILKYGSGNAVKLLKACIQSKIENI